MSKDIGICEKCGLSKLISKKWLSKNTYILLCGGCNRKYKKDKLIIPFRDASRGNVGCCSELSVCVGLMKFGFGVFRNISSHGYYDIIAVDSNDKCLKIESTTGQVHSDTKKRSYCYHSKYSDKWDIIAVVYYDIILYYNKECAIVDINDLYSRSI